MGIFIQTRAKTSAIKYYINGKLVKVRIPRKTKKKLKKMISNSPKTFQGYGFSRVMTPDEYNRFNEVIKKFRSLI